GRGARGGGGGDRGVCRQCAPGPGVHGVPRARGAGQGTATGVEEAGARRRQPHVGELGMSVSISPELRRPLVDRYGRVHTDLRISLTDKCSLRCTYCMPAEGVPWLQRDMILTTDELVRVAEVAAALGIATVRLTGGEPLLRRDVVDVVARMSRIEGSAGPLELSMTTNGLLLPKLAADLAAAGLQRVNISLDTLRPERFHELTRRDRFADVLAGIEAAQAAGLSRSRSTRWRCATSTTTRSSTWCAS